MGKLNMTADPKDRDIQRRIKQEMAAIRKAWRLIEPELNYRDPQWLRSASSHASKAGKLPRCKPWESVINQLHIAGYGKLLDHYAVVRVDGERHAIFEPYESRCSMDTARRMADELASKLNCHASASLRSWHVPGATIRVTLAPLHTVAPVATEAARANDTSSRRDDATERNVVRHVASAKVALNFSGATCCSGSSGQTPPLLGVTEQSRYLPQFLC